MLKDLLKKVITHIAIKRFKLEKEWIGKLYWLWYNCSESWQDCAGW